MYDVPLIVIKTLKLMIFTNLIAFDEKNDTLWNDVCYRLVKICNHNMIELTELS